MTDLIDKAKNLIKQIEMSDFTDENGMKLKLNVCLKELKEAIERIESERIDRKFGRL